MITIDDHIEPDYRVLAEIRGEKLDRVEELADKWAAHEGPLKIVMQAFATELRNALEAK